MENSQQRQAQLSGREYVGFLVTNLLKLAGAATGMIEAFTHDEVRPLVLGFAALLIAGGQAVETFFASFFGIKR